MSSKPTSLFWNRLQLIMIVVVFAAPIVAAFLYKPSSFNNFGDIYTPVRVVDSLPLVGEGVETNLDQMRHKWLFVVFAQGDCEQACEDNILKIRQVRFMQNDDMKRIRTLFLHSELEQAIATDLDAKYQPMESYAVDAQEYEQWTKILEIQGAPPEAQRDRIYIIDPAGNLMMSYPAGTPPEHMKKDIKRLLKASQIG